MNKCIFLGNLTADPELRETKNGTSLASFTLAMNRYYKDKNGEKVEDTQFLDFVVWGDKAENFCKFFSKGNKVLVETSAYKESWEDKEGNKRYAVRFRVENFYFTGGKNGNGNTKSEPVSEASGEDDEYDIPF